MAASCEGSASEGACSSACARFRVGHRSRADLFSTHCRYARIPSASARTATTPIAPAATFARFSLHQATVRRTWNEFVGPLQVPAAEAGLLCHLCGLSLDVR